MNVPSRFFSRIFVLFLCYTVPTSKNAKPIYMVTICTEAIKIQMVVTRPRRLVKIQSMSFLL